MRDFTEKCLLDYAVKNKIPVLGICRGMQFINVYFGGKLIQNISKEIKSSFKHVAKDHLIELLDKRLHSGKRNQVKVNSYHNQGVDNITLSSKLNCFAKSTDGVIEGIFHPNLPIVGIEWHPERNSPDKEFNYKLIKAFLKEDLFWKRTKKIK